MKPPSDSGIMKNSKSSTQHRRATGFVTPAVMMIIAVLLILGIGALALVSNERKTSRSHLDALRAELAVNAGLETVRSIFQNQALNDDFLVIPSKPVEPSATGQPVPDHLFLVRGKKEDDAFSFHYVPLFSDSGEPLSTSQLTSPDLDSRLPTGSEGRTEIPTHRYFDAAPVAWKTIEDDESRAISRYAYFVEDLQGRLDPSLAGNQAGPEGTHARSKWPFPVSGISSQPVTDDEKPLSEVKLNAIEPVSGSLTKTFEQNRNLLVSPRSLLAAADLKPPIVRDEKTGRITDPLGRTLEENLVSGIMAYEEQPIVPFLPGIDPAAAGKTKLNLNGLLATGGEEAVDEMAEFIKNALPNFETRKGGMKEDYLKTLAASALDYADEDSDSTTKTGSYRGIDSFPLVSELAMRFRWENIIEKNGRKYISLSVSSYAELWNMSDQEAQGEIQLSYETFYDVKITPIEKVGTETKELPPVVYSLRDLSAVVENDLIESQGYQWFPPQSVTMKPNEYRLLTFGPLIYEIEIGEAKHLSKNPINFSGEDGGHSPAGYRLRWNGKIVDRLNKIDRDNSSIYFPSPPKVETVNTPRQFVRLTSPSLKHGNYGSYTYNMGDCRFSYYLQNCSSPNLFPQNFSPNRRNVRYEIYSADPFEISARVLPSEWPDGGHNSPYGSNAFYTTDKKLKPDDPRFFEGIIAPRKEDAPVRISNAGRFYSAVELGKVFDPLMWQVSEPTPSKPWGDVTLSSIASENYGGGNTLRIGRAEHPRFAFPDSSGLQACRLLDLFHTGISRSESKALREGPVVKINGNINLNTATRDVLRAMLAGPLVMDPILAKRKSDQHDTELLAPPTEPLSLSPPMIETEADRFADAIIAARPFASTADLAQVKQNDGQPVFGNRSLFAEGDQIEWSDSAAEELFGRIYESSTVRSRNFRVWVVGQCLSPSATAGGKAEVLAESRKVFTVFVDPGERMEDGAIDLTKAKVRVINECEY